MIQSLTISNFLSHKKTALEFSPGLNIIVGPTDSGKSAIIKALKWLITNRPLGDSVRSYWGGSTSVSVQFKEGEVLRVREDRDNAYKTIVGGNSIEFNAIKGEVPEEVGKILDLGELNIQTQFSPHFLLSQSSGEVAQYFNKVAHLDKIDTASQNIRRWLKEVQQSISFREAELIQFQSDLEQYKTLDEIEEKVVELEKVEKQITDTDWDKIQLQKLIEDLSKAEEELEGFSFLLELEGLVNEIIKITEERVKVGVQKTELNELLASLQMCDTIAQRHEKEIKEQEILFHKYLREGKVCPLCESVI